MKCQGGVCSGSEICALHAEMRAYSEPGYDDERAPDPMAARLLALESLVRRQRVSLTALVARIRRNGGFSTTEEQYALRVAELEMGEVP